jgi:2-methylisocitrate lyase-like PEP mutase family enzyme
MNADGDARRAMFRRLVEGDALVVCPGVTSALFARLAAQAGFELIFATGEGIAKTHLGAPDLGLLTMTEQLEISRRIVQAVDIPVLADVDAGYGGALNVYRTVTDFEAAGVAGVVLEDQVNPKRRGHLGDRQIVSLSEMLERVIGACEARRDPDLVIVARTDAVATRGIAEAIRRANAFAAAGADMVLVEMPERVEDVARIPAEVSAPALIGVVDGALPPARLREMGYRAVVYANTVLAVALTAAADGLSLLRETGHSRDLLPRMLTWDGRQNLVDLDGWLGTNAAIGAAAERIAADARRVGLASPQPHRD